MGNDPTTRADSAETQPTGPTAVGTPIGSIDTADPSPAAPGQVDLTRVRDLVLAANPDVVPEMIAGDSFDAILASVEPAKAAYKRIVEATTSAAQGQTQTAAAPNVGTAGAPGRSTYTITIEELSPSAKIAEGVRRRNSRAS